ncbi:hypothetical protein PF010_g15502 [Phytophthora fragariae]|uniref:CCHC-type domain-containing protein n=1 Tax=Phytophthora fragariae TaxID=53985 RepID=A0A6G0KUP6_9STRA|nr:hypothetical protein PF010_g15502 [Phytophthora fragariae]KAE9218936.1 hypothetical protein PF004_g13750 [Phytophthora fragariae]
MAEPKLRAETYQEYAQRLLNMADSLPGGLSAEANARHAMHTFIKRAYFKYADELKSFVERLPASSSAGARLHRLVDHLAYMADSDGRLPPKGLNNSKLRDSTSFKRVKHEEGQQATKQAQATTQIVEHKHKAAHHAQSRRTSKSRRYEQPGDGRDIVRCFNCRQSGHIARNCPERGGAAKRPQGSAAAALKEDSA